MEKERFPGWLDRLMDGYARVQRQTNLGCTKEEYREIAKEIIESWIDKKPYRTVKWYFRSLMQDTFLIEKQSDCVCYNRSGEVCSWDTYFDDEILEVYLGWAIPGPHVWPVPSATEIRSLGLNREQPRYMEEIDRQIYGDEYMDKVIKQREEKQELLKNIKADPNADPEWINF